MRPEEQSIPDWAREKKTRTPFEPWKHVLENMRNYQKSKNRWFFSLIKPYLVLKHRVWSAYCGLDLPLNTRIGGGLLLIHPNGIVVHPGVTIGPNCLILHQVTLGTGSKPGVPVIGANVEIGAGAKILGGVTIGDGAKVGANAVVIDSIPQGATAVGVPARIVKRSQ